MYGLYAGVLQPMSAVPLASILDSCQSYFQYCQGELWLHLQRVSVSEFARDVANIRDSQCPSFVVERAALLTPKQ